MRRFIAGVARTKERIEKMEIKVEYHLVLTVEEAHAIHWLIDATDDEDYKSAGIPDEDAKICQNIGYLLNRELP